MVISDTLEDLVNEGKIHYYGWSTDDPERAKEFAKGKNCTVIQFILNILRNNTPMANLCEMNDLAGIIRQPMQSGILSGKYTKETKRASNHFYANVDFTTERYEKIFNSLNSLKDLLKNNNLTMVQTALGYIWAKNKKVIPIPGAKTVEQITENAKTLESGPISQNFMREIDSLFKELHHDFSYDNFEYYKSK